MLLDNLQKFTSTSKTIPLKWRAPEELVLNKRVIVKVPHVYNLAIKGRVHDDTPSTGIPAAGANLTTAQIEM